MTIKPQSPCKRWKKKELGKNEYWSPNMNSNTAIVTTTEDNKTSFGEYFDNQRDAIIKAMQNKNKQLNVEWMERYEKRQKSNNNDV